MPGADLRDSSWLIRSHHVPVLYGLAGPANHKNELVFEIVDRALPNNKWHKTQSTFWGSIWKIRVTLYGKLFILTSSDNIVAVLRICSMAKVRWLKKLLLFSSDSTPVLANNWNRMVKNKTRNVMKLIRKIQEVLENSAI